MLRAVCIVYVLARPRRDFNGAKGMGKAANFIRDEKDQRMDSRKGQK
jgi:hypothetical protein